MKVAKKEKIKKINNRFLISESKLKSKSYNPGPGGGACFDCASQPPPRPR